jgi:two-component system sensor histidine kinase HydH
MKRSDFRDDFDDNHDREHEREKGLKKTYKNAYPQKMDPKHQMMPHEPKDPKAVRYCWVGFNMDPFEASERSARMNTTIYIGLCALAGFAGIMALFLAHNSRLTRRLYQDTNALASEIIGRLPIGLIINDNEGKVTLVNSTALKISGLSESDFLHKKLSSITFGAFPQDEELWSHECDVRFKGGHSPRLSITAGPIVAKDGVKVGRVILLADLGELGRLRAELAEKERLATLGSMARGLAHEIRNPLSAIKGLTQHLLKKTGNNTPEEEALEVILTSVERLAETITDFLDYARPTKLEPSPLDLGTFLGKLHNLIIHDADCENVTVNFDVPPKAIEILADDTLLAQAFLNLFLNAIQATQDNPPERPGEVTVHLILGANSKAVITVADNGPGFGEEQLARPFVPYFTSKAQGCGLGLALVKKIVEAHEGQVILGNQETGGAQVTVVLPLLPANYEKPQECTFTDPQKIKSESYAPEPGTLTN